MLRRKGQSILEYVIIFTAIIAGIVFVANSVMKTKVQDSITHVGEQMDNQVKKISFE